MEDIPLDFQWGLLERKVGSNAVAQIKEELSRATRPLEVEAVRAEDNNVTLLRSGWHNGKRHYSIRAYNFDGSLKDENEFEASDLENINLGSAILLGTVTFGATLIHYLITKRPKIQKRIELTKDFEQARTKLVKANIEDAMKISKSIALYPESLETLVARTNKQIRPVNTNNSHSYIVENGELLLRVRAGLLGANALVDFSEKEYNVFKSVAYGCNYGNVTTRNEKCSIGIPVKIE